MSATSQRQQILEAIDARLWTLYNATDGSVEELFNQHRVGGLQPMKMDRPRYTVIDGGQRRDRPGDDQSEDRSLLVRIALHICDTWEDEDTVQEWTDRVEGIIKRLHGRPGYGITTIRYLRDEPIDVVFMSGAMQGDWIIEFEVTYFVDVDEFDDWDDE